MRKKDKQSNSKMLGIGKKTKKGSRWRPEQKKDEGCKGNKRRKGEGEDGKLEDTRESELPADDRRTVEEYKLPKKRSGRGERKGEAKKNEKRPTYRKNIETSKDRERKGKQEEMKNETLEP